MSATPLSDILIRMIRDEGPMPLDRYMGLCLGHPEHGYYMSRDPFGAAGDFITAPEVSQLFGELIGIWCASAFSLMQSPPEVNLIELGPGRGTLMSDILRAAVVSPAFASAVRVHLVETSPALRRVQAQNLKVPVTWHVDLQALPEGASLLVANEFFDAIPVRQFQYRGGNWAERYVGIGPSGNLAIGLAPTARSFAPQAEGAIVEVSPERDTIAGLVGAHLKGSPAYALIIDYGHLHSAPGHTLQAVRGHRHCDILDVPGECDLTSHVDFEAMASALARNGASVCRPMTQRQFLLAMGIEARTAKLTERASPADRLVIAGAVDRLVGESQMGNLFKVMAASSPGLPVPYPFGS
jgi:NADH dehydrogenase [ubiquinone] 1 alpha subcomplex assembly factor 7